MPTRKVGKIETKQQRQLTLLGVCVLRGKGKLGSVISVFAELFSRRFDGVCGRFF